MSYIFDLPVTPEQLQGIGMVAAEWSQERLAEHADLDRGYIAGIEVGARNPSLKALERLAAALRVQLADLFCN